MCSFLEGEMYLRFLWNVVNWGRVKLCYVEIDFDFIKKNFNMI